jgi:hypothetical protein
MPPDDSTYRDFEHESLTIVVCLERVKNGGQLQVIEFYCVTISCASSHEKGYA